MIRRVRLAIMAMFLMMFTLRTLAQDQEVINFFTEDRGLLIELLKFFGSDGNMILAGVVWTGGVVLFTWIRSGGNLTRGDIFDNSEALGEFIIVGGETIADFLDLMGRLDIPNADESIESLEKAIRTMLDEMGTSADLLLIKEENEE